MPNEVFCFSAFILRLPKYWAIFAKFQDLLPKIARFFVTLHDFFMVMPRMA